MKPLLPALLCVGLSCAGTAAGEDVYLGLRRAGLQPIPVAIPPFSGEAEGTTDPIPTLRSVLIADLEFSVLVEPVTDPSGRYRSRYSATVDKLRGLLGRGEDVAETVARPDTSMWAERSELLRDTVPFPVVWERAGVGIALSVRIDPPTEAGSGRRSLGFELSFIGGGPPLAQGGRVLGPDNARAVAHEIADEVVLAAAGEPGIATSRIAYALPGEGNARRIVVADYDGAQSVAIGCSDDEALMPSFFPGRSRLACIRYGEKGPDLVTYTIPPLGHAETLLSARPGLESTPAVSPDGSEVAFTLNMKGNNDIYVIASRGGDLRRLTFSPGIDTSPSWSPTGGQLVYTSDRSGTPSIYVMGRTGLAQRNLMVQPGYLDAAAWSPRGDRIAYVAREGGRFHVFTIDPLGGAPRRITDRGNNESPCWSPDGLHLIISSDRSGASEIYTMRLDGSAVRRVAHTKGAITPTWSPPPRNQDPTIRKEETE
ncbi:MAG: hypothetical protein CME06_14930 [Gemmatimonadetes bacterium]|nr:hypothetical protein [Gemmatimonadota bacterium]